MAKNSGVKNGINPQHTQTSIGKSVNTHPKNKRKRKDWKPYRGQGK